MAAVPFTLLKSKKQIIKEETINRLYNYTTSGYLIETESIGLELSSTHNMDFLVVQQPPLIL